MSDIDAAVIKRTQDALGKYIKKPPLSEKLLKKPPFRFLYDVFHALIKETGCFEGLYTSEEQNIDNIKDRDDKMLFLQKMIDVIKIITKKTPSVRTSKIVAGQEPDKTNELLQLMGEVIEKQLDWKSAVKAVTSKATTTQDKEKPKERVKLKEKERSIDKEKMKEKDKPKEPEKTKIREKPKDTELKTKIKESLKVKEKSKDIKTKEKSKERTSTKSTPSPTTKDEKPLKKTTSSKEKSKNESRPAKDKVSKETKAIKKPTETKTTNSIITTKEKPPSPVKEIPKEVKSPQKDTTNQQSPKKLIETTESSSSLQADVFGEVSNSKDLEDKTVDIVKTLKSSVKEGNDNTQTIGNNDNLKHDSPAKKPNSLPQEYGSPKIMDSRKSSGSHRNSGKSRRSSANKVRKDENENNQSSLNTMESLNTLNEEVTPIAPVAITRNSTVKEEEEIPTPKPTAVDVPDMKRESTFTRENSRDSGNGAIRPRTSLRPPSARPASARPGAPRRRDRNVEIILQPNDQLKLSGINVKLETFGDFEDDGENLVVIENTQMDDTLTESRVAKTEEPLEQQGHLVQQILETQMELVQQPHSDLAGKQDKDEISSALNNRQSSARQMNNLRDIIQNLTKSVNPFGKLMDFIPEDIDAMQLELSMWRDNYTQAASELRKERSLTESVTEPMKNQLVQIEVNIKEYQEMINASRTKILQISEKIQKMLTEQ